MSIISKFMNVVWDIWDFRNSLVYGKGGLHDKALHNELDVRINEEFDLGEQELLPTDRRLITNYKCTILLESSKEYKQAWLRQIDTAQQAVHYNESETIATTTQYSIMDYFEVVDNNM